MEVKYHGYYKNIKTSKVYAVIGLCKIKSKEDWVNGIMYLRNGEIFCRLKSEFDRKFSREPRKLFDRNHK